MSCMFRQLVEMLLLIIMSVYHGGRGSVTVIARCKEAKEFVS